MKLEELTFSFLLIGCIKIKVCKLQGLVMVTDTYESRKDGTKHSDEDDNFIPVMHVNDLPRSYENYSSIHGIAKKVSHSKGIIINKNPNELDEGVQLRRSVSRKLLISSYSDVIEDLLHQFLEGSGDKLSILKQIEYLVHEYDVAVFFTKIGGLESISPFLLSTKDELVLAAALLLGTAMQSNPEVQEHAVKQNVGDSLLECLKSNKNHTFPHILFALSAYLRNMPEAQEKFYHRKGIYVLANLLKSSSVTTKAKMRIIDLLHDMAMEYQINETDVKSEDFQRLQNLEVILVTQVKESEICEEFSQLLMMSGYNVHQKVIASMRAVRPYCNTVFKQEIILQKIHGLLAIYTGDYPVEFSSSSYAVDLSLDDDLKESLGEEIKLLINDISASLQKESMEEKVKKEEL